ncbi:MAG: hypothetical protein HW418_4081, partial [Anaerolineales bacterium]|nr:hypothetical protein [Anaerolineales bacterium]
AYLLNQPTLPIWPDMREGLQRMADRRPRDWRLPVVACEAVGETPEQALPAVAAIACLQLSIILIDDLLDADPRGEYHRLGSPAAANLAAAFQAAGLEAVAQSDIDQVAKLAALRSLNAMALTTALGQYWDTLNPADEEGYWRLVQTKSSPFFGAALHVGALFGGAPPEVAEQLRQIGMLYGEMIQIHDDLSDALAVPANPDWTLGRSPLPILFAQVVDHPDRARFLELRQAIPDAEALAEAQSILIRCGAVSYGVHQLLTRYQSAAAMLRAMSLLQPAGLQVLLDDVVAPVQKLFAELGVEAIITPTPI